MTRVNIWALLALYLVTLMLVLGIDIMHMRPDEHLVYFFTRRDLPFLVNYLATQDSHPPLWFSSFWLWQQLAGTSEWAGRFYSVLLNMLTLSLVYRLGRRWFGASRYGVFAVLLLGSSAFYFTYVLEIRPYSFILLLVTLSMWTFQRWLTRRTWRTAAYYGLTVVAMLYVHYFLFVLLLIQALYALFYILTKQLGWRVIGQGILAAVVALVIWLPWLPWAFNQIANVRQAEEMGGNERGLLGAGSTTLPTSWTTVNDLAALATNGLTLLYIALLLIGLIYLWRNANYLLALLWAIGVPALSLLINPLIAIYTPRYVVYMTVGVALAVGASLASLPLPRLRIPALLVVVALSSWFLPQHLPEGRTPYRDLFREVSAQAQPDDVIFFDRSADAGTRFVRWQIDAYLDPQLSSNRVQSVAEAQRYRRVWYVTADWFNPDERANFEAIEASHPLQYVAGDCTSNWCYLLQLLEAPPLVAPIIFGDTLLFHGMDRLVVRGDSLDFRLWWTVTQPPSDDLSFSLQLLDATGVLVAQSDGSVRDQYHNLEPVPTSQMKPDRFYIDHQSIDITGLPPGDYNLALVVYQPWDGVRLITPDHDMLTLTTVTIQ